MKEPRVASVLRALKLRRPDPQASALGNVSAPDCRDGKKTFPFTLPGSWLRHSLQRERN